jgi:predicted nucleic acid-binding Zn ribbon protein
MISAHDLGGPVTDPHTERQRQTVLAFRAAGVVLTLVGAVLLISGFVGFAGSMSSASDTSFDQGPDGPPSSFWLMFAAMPFLAAGAFCLKAGFFGAASRFVARESTPALRQIMNDLQPAPTTGPTRFCPACGAARASHDRFCAGCGAALTTP